MTVRHVSLPRVPYNETGQSLGELTCGTRAARHRAHASHELQLSEQTGRRRACRAAPWLELRLGQTRPTLPLWFPSSSLSEVDSEGRGLLHSDGKTTETILRDAFQFGAQRCEIFAFNKDFPFVPYDGASFTLNFYLAWLINRKISQPIAFADVVFEFAGIFYFEFFRFRGPRVLGFCFETVRFRHLEQRVYFFAAFPFEACSFTTDGDAWEYGGAYQARGSERDYATPFSVYFQ
jgi:hypothetical protein